MTWSSKDNSARLQEIAGLQGGFFTTREAQEAGYVDAVHGYHVKAGHWIKVQRGIYQLSECPEVPDPHPYVAVLWARNRSGKPGGALSHETAAHLHGMKPKITGDVHLTVPRDFRRNSETPGFIVLHKADLMQDDFVEQDGLLLTTRTRTAHDLGLPTERNNNTRPSSYDAIINAGED